MARTFGKFTTTIYDSDEFRALTFAQQGVYYMLGLQGEISAAGVLPLRFKRWTRNASDATVSGLQEALDHLAALGHVVYDEDTEELLIVKFVKWDKGYANEKRRPVVAEAAGDIASLDLRRALAEELRGIASDMASDAISDTASDAISAWLSRLASDIAPDTASDTASDTTSRFDRSVVKEGEYVPPLLKPQSGREEPSPLDADDEPSPFCTKHPAGTEQPCGPCGTAKRRNKAWHTAAPERARRVAARVRERQAAANNCTRCDGTWITDDDGRPTRDKCNHRRTA